MSNQIIFKIPSRLKRETKAAFEIFVKSYFENFELVYTACDSYIIECEDKSLVISQDDELLNSRFLSDIFHGYKRFYPKACKTKTQTCLVLSPREGPLRFEKYNNQAFMQDDIITPLMEFNSYRYTFPGQSLSADGVLSIEDNRSKGIGSEFDGTDFCGQLAAYIADYFSLKTIERRKAIFTFDCDGFTTESLANMQNMMREYGGKESYTIFVMGNGAKGTLYDPKYELSNPKLRDAIEGCEIGLHSSYLAHINPTVLKEEVYEFKRILGTKPKVHRGHYLRNLYPVTQANLISEGFEFDFTTGFYDGQGSPTLTALPYCLPDPRGSFKSLTLVPTVLMDQHLAYYSKPIQQSNANDRDNYIKTLVDHWAEYSVIPVIDWHVHALDISHYPLHMDILYRLLDELKAHGFLLDTASNIYKPSNFQPEWIKDAAVTLKSLEEVINEEPIEPPSDFSNWYQRASYSVAFRPPYYTQVTALFFEKILLDESIFTICDIGCGSGWIISKAGKNRQTLLVDQSNTYRVDTEKPFLSMDTLSAWLKNNSTTRKFDLVTLIDVIEHLNSSETDEVISLVCGALANKYVYIQTPNDEIIDDSIGVCTRCGYQGHLCGHKVSLKLQDLKQICPVGWEVLSTVSSGPLDFIQSSNPLLNRESTIPSIPYTCPACNEETFFIDTSLLRGNHPEKCLSDGSERSYAECGVLLKRIDSGVELHRLEQFIAKMRLDSQSARVFGASLSNDLPKRITKTTTTRIDFTSYFIDSGDCTSSNYLLPSFFHISGKHDFVEKGLSLLESDGQNMFSVHFPMPIKQGTLYRLQFWPFAQESLYATLTITEIDISGQQIQEAVKEFLLTTSTLELVCTASIDCKGFSIAVDTMHGSVALQSIEVLTDGRSYALAQYDETYSGSFNISLIEGKPHLSYIEHDGWCQTAERSETYLSTCIEDAAFPQHLEANILLAEEISRALALQHLKYTNRLSKRIAPFIVRTLRKTWQIKPLIKTAINKLKSAYRGFN